jgi:hypothetical protein
MVEYHFDRTLQQTFEDFIIGIMEKIREDGGVETITSKKLGNELINWDVQVTDKLFKKFGSDYRIISEEREGGNVGSDVVIIADPIDGSSEVNRIGSFRSPLSSAVMAIKESIVLAAAVVDIWGQKVYGIDKEGLYYYLISDEKKIYISISEYKKEKVKTPEKVFIALYAPNQKRLNLALPLFSRFPYVHNNGGHLFALQVVEGRSHQTYSASLEILPKELWEQIGPIMAHYGGAYLCRLNGKRLKIDLGIKQTSITTVNEDIANTIIELLHPVYEKTHQKHVINL